MHPRLLVLLLLPFLAACATPPAAESYVFIPPDSPGGRLCLSQCTEAESFCSEGCDIAQRQCVTGVEQQAITDYDRYTRMQFASGEPIELRPRDFERTVPCDDARHSCDESCDKHYRSCYETCGGKVDVISSCQFLCF